MNHRSPGENRGALPRAEHVKSSRKLKSFRENYEGHRKPRRSNVKTFAYHLQQITKGMLKFGQFQFTPCRLTRPACIIYFQHVLKLQARRNDHPENCSLWACIVLAAFGSTCRVCRAHRYTINCIDSFVGYATFRGSRTNGSRCAAKRVAGGNGGSGGGCRLKWRVLFCHNLHRGSLFWNALPRSEQRSPLPNRASGTLSWSLLALVIASRSRRRCYPPSHQRRSRRELREKASR
ncbi:hypothetical protein PUN28_001952 [Cardiocondyla obscurior]|uniref:Uncharacterized protein n=1 Tax=Cardiocondyla obscurior TaxID=286306 RepID=A0AAW2GRW5_9HYME